MRGDVFIGVCDGVPMVSGSIYSKAKLKLDLQSNQDEQENILTGSPKWCMSVNVHGCHVMTFFLPSRYLATKFGPSS
jgi:hypothetical protein